MLLKMQLKTYLDGTSSGPGVKDLPIDAGGSGLIPWGEGTKSPPAVEQLSSWPQLLSPSAPQLESQCSTMKDTVKILHAETDPRQPNK